MPAGRAGVRSEPGTTRGFFSSLRSCTSWTFSHPPTLLIMSQKYCGVLPTGFWSVQIKTENTVAVFYFQKYP